MSSSIAGSVRYEAANRRHGVSGSGKSTVGAALAQRLRVSFADADDFHPPVNVAKMTAGHALDDNDRFPWLETIGEWLADHADGGVMSCSPPSSRSIPMKAV